MKRASSLLGALLGSVPDSDLSLLDHFPYATWKSFGESGGQNVLLTPNELGNPS